MGPKNLSREYFVFREYFGFTVFQYFSFTAELEWSGGAKFPTGLQLVRDSTCLYQSLTDF